MPKTTKRQVGFYADEDIEKLLGEADPGQKTRIINAALRAWYESRNTIDARYSSQLQSLIDWLKIQQDPLVLSTKSGKSISLARILQKFAHQDRLRPPHLQWAEIVDEGITFTMPNDGETKPLMVPMSTQNRCAMCQKPLTNPQDVINTPSRGKVCRSCFEIPMPKRPKTDEFQQQVGEAYQLLVAIDQSDAANKVPFMDAFDQYSFEVQEAAANRFRTAQGKAPLRFSDFL